MWRFSFILVMVHKRDFLEGILPSSNKLEETHWMTSETQKPSYLDLFYYAYIFKCVSTKSHYVPFKIWYWIQVLFKPLAGLISYITVGLVHSTPYAVILVTAMHDSAYCLSLLSALQCTYTDVMHMLCELQFAVLG